MRELAVRYKAEKVCHEEMVKMPLVDLKVLEVRGETNYCECKVFRSSYRVSTRSDIDCEGPCRLAPTEMKRVVGIVARAARMRYGRYEFTAMPFWVDQCTSDFHGHNESGARVAVEDEFGAAEEREVSCDAQQGRSGVKRKLFRSYRNNMGNEPILALPKGSDNFVLMRGARARMLA
ncbi:hypothetical protein Tco_0511511 [Tanacetum coccineum]